MGRLYKYTMISILREKVLAFWLIIFPLLLATIESLTIGRAFEAEQFQPAKAVIIYNQENEDFKAVIDELSKKDDNQLIEVLDLTEEEAQKALNKRQLDGIFYVNDNIHLEVNYNGIGETILSCVLEQFEQKYELISNVITTNPAKLQDIIDMSEKEHTYFTNMDETNMNSYLQYFYALFSMTCMYACFLGLDRVMKMQANLTPLGQRREVSPTHKMKQILTEYLAMMTVEAVISIFMIFFFEVILKIHLAVNPIKILPVLLLGNSVGISMGIAVGSLNKLSERVRSGICICISMIISFFSGLMFDGIRQDVDRVCPIVNKMNPGALIVDSFYALSIYDTYDRYIMNLIILAVISVIMCFVGFLLMRRNSYEHL